MTDNPSPASADWWESSKHHLKNQLSKPAHTRTKNFRLEKINLGSNPEILLRPFRKVTSELMEPRNGTVKCLQERRFLTPLSACISKKKKRKGIKMGKTWSCSIQCGRVVHFLIRWSLSPGITVPWHHYFLASLSPGITIPWHHYLLASLSPGTTISWDHYPQASLSPGITITWHHYLLASLSSGITISWHHYILASISHDITISWHHYLLASLSPGIAISWHYFSLAP